MTGSGTLKIVAIALCAWCATAGGQAPGAAELAKYFACVDRYAAPYARTAAAPADVADAAVASCYSTLLDALTVLQKLDQDLERLRAIAADYEKSARGRVIIAILAVRYGQR